MPVQQTATGSRNVATSTPRAGNYPTTPTPTTKTQATTGKVTGADDGWISTVTQKAEIDFDVTLFPRCNASDVPETVFLSCHNNIFSHFSGKRHCLIPDSRD